MTLRFSFEPLKHSLALVAALAVALTLTPPRAARADAGDAIRPPAALTPDTDQTAPVAADAAGDQPAADTTPETAVAAETPQPAEDAGTTPDETVTADAGGDAQSVDPDRLLDSLVQQALNEALPDQALPANDQAAPEGQDGGQTAAAPAVEGTDTPQLASASATAAIRQLSLPSGLDVPPTAEVAFNPPAPPPPFGTDFTFDENGLVEATPEGALTPSGITVFARRPAVVPAPRPGGTAPEAAAQTEPAPAAPAAPEPAAPEPAVAPEATAPETAPVEAAPVETVAPDTPRADPALARFRPQPRSARVRALTAPQAPAAQPEPDPGTDQTLLDAPAEGTPTDTAALETPPPGGVSLAALRPQRRPSDFAAPADPTATDTPTADEIAALDLQGATPEAVTRSLIPGARPDDFAERAQQVLAAAQSRPESGAAANDDGEPDSGSSRAAPEIPTSASVARQATETDAIRLNRVNLIGVFGTPDARRALVRTSTGRMVRVSVGDRLDGGRVTAIGEDELRYTKNGRNEVLRIGG